MKVCVYKTLLNEDGTPYLAEERSYETDGWKEFTTPDEIADFITTHLQIQRCAEEYVYLLCFDNRNHLTGLAEISHGTVAVSLMSSREVLQKALLLGAVKIVLTHNHPGGDPTPSGEDINSTKAIGEACHILGIELLDHLIVSQSGWRSMRELELL